MGELFNHKSDRSWKNHFPRAASSGGARDPFHGTPEDLNERRRRQEDVELENESIREGDPVPTGEGENPHANDPPVPKKDDSPPALER